MEDNTSVDPTKVVGHYVKPAEWNELISDPNTLLIDTRNTYEVKIGTFQGAVNPYTTSFREFQHWVSQKRDTLEKKTKIAMFCTGGIRCEKATSYLRDQGFDDVYHLEGGILKYLEEISPQESMWEGQCFVFDERVSVGHGLKPGEYDLCHGCRSPIDDVDKASEFYVQGVSCPYCHDQTTEEQRARFAERQKQMMLAKTRNELHLGRVHDHTPKSND